MKKFTTIAVVLLMTSQVFAQTRDYSGWLDKVVKFYGYQRAGLASGSSHNLNSGWSTSNHGGDNYNGKPLDGGWYDAGDYIKFGMNASYSVYSLLKGYDVFPTAYPDNYAWDYSATKDGVPDILNEVKFATDYFMKAVIDENTVVLDVGNASSEHGTWGPVNTSGRSGNDKIFTCSGADIPATYAACLALMSTLYRPFDTTYANQCLAKAKTAYIFAKKKCDEKSFYCTPQPGDFYIYPSVDGNVVKQIEDRMGAAGIELYRASNYDPTYLPWAKKIPKDNYNCMGYSSIGPLVSFEQWRQGLDVAAYALSGNIGFIDSKVKDSGPFKNVFNNTGWGTARDVGTVAFEYALAYVIQTDETKRADIKKRVQDHIDWITGGNIGQTNPRSYICGINGGPTSIHYRTTNYGAVPGAVVAGPDDKGEWSGQGKDYQYTEVAVDYNAGIPGALAFMKLLSDPNGAVTVSTSFKATPTTAVDLNSKTVTFSAGFSKSVNWTLKIAGSFGSKTIKKTSNAVNETWDGTADNGMFISGEKAIASLSIEGGSIIAYDLVKVSPVGIEIAKAKKPQASSKDVNIDDFEDSDTINKVSGNWVKFGTGTGMKATKTSFVADTGTKTKGMLIDANVSTNDHKNNAGVKATFNSAGTAFNMGNPLSVAFDLRASKSVDVYVELEQSSITDSAYYSVAVPVNISSNSYRIKLSDFKQPDWKTSAKALDLANISSLRFTIYDSTGIVKLYLDNVVIEDFKSSVSVSSRLIRSSLRPAIVKNSIIYSAPCNVNGDFDVAIYNMLGKIVMKRTLNVYAGKPVSVSIAQLPTGMYTVVNSVKGKVMGEKFTFAYTK